jgi:hypothetical protein
VLRACRHANDCAPQARCRECADTGTAFKTLETGCGIDWHFVDHTTAEVGLDGLRRHLEEAVDAASSAQHRRASDSACKIFLLDRRREKAWDKS